MSSSHQHHHNNNNPSHSNVHFESYYRHQLFSNDEKAFQSLLQTFSKPLPVTFRITKNVHTECTINALKRIIESEQQQQQQQQRDVLHVRTISFLNDPRTFQIDNSFVNNETNGSGNENDLKTKHPNVHQFLARANEGGDLSRQELVSMIPVKLLDVKPSHLVLDSCASPGSKTSQILEVMLSKNASGAVVANDASLQRANLLTHRCYRLEAAAKNLVVVNHDAQTLPLELENTFDRILCDVPCSGDGTLRKSTDLWKKWSNSSGVELHSIQVNVATRALRLLKYDDGGGRLVYSTCSLNPLENEAVVVELLQRSRGAIKLVDCSKMLPDLKRLPGLTKWSVQDLKNGKLHFSTQSGSSYRSG